MVIWLIPKNNGGFSMKRSTKIILWIILLTVLDNVATVCGLKTGMSVEINVFAHLLFQWSALWGWIVIIAWQTIFIWLASIFIIRYKWAHYGGMFLIGFKSAVILMHIYTATMILSNMV